MIDFKLTGYKLEIRDLLFGFVFIVSSLISLYMLE